MGQFIGHYQTLFSVYNWALFTGHAVRFIEAKSIGCPLISAQYKCRGMLGHGQGLLSTFAIDLNHLVGLQMS